MSYSSCTEECYDSKVTVKENRSRFVLNNESRYKVLRTKVDGCFIQGHEERCDWLLSTDQPEKMAYLVELKGKDIDKAISQLSATLDKLPQSLASHKKICIAVTTRIPKYGPSMRTRYEDFMKRNGVKLTVKNSNYEVFL